jgi:hypothetical protein
MDDMSDVSAGSRGPPRHDWSIGEASAETHSRTRTTLAVEVGSPLAALRSLLDNYSTGRVAARDEFRRRRAVGDQSGAGVHQILSNTAEHCRCWRGRRTDLTPGKPMDTRAASPLPPVETRLAIDPATGTVVALTVRTRTGEPIAQSPDGHSLAQRAAFRAALKARAVDKLA